MQLRKIFLASTVLCACGDDAGSGSAKFTSWGEAYIELELPPDPTGETGFIDGWTVEFDKFLVVYHAISVADARGDVAATMAGSKFVDNVVAGRKDLVTFSDLEAKQWDRVGYQIKPALADTEVVAGKPEDKDMMAANGYSIYVSGMATKPGAQTKTFHWGFKTATQYSNCQQSAASGQPLEGMVVTNGGTEVAELTTHGDHFFYDRLTASANPAQRTSLRFEEKAAADINGDNEVTLEELLAARIDVRTYNPSPFAATTLGAFMIELARTVGHFYGEGECTVSAIP